MKCDVLKRWPLRGINYPRLKAVINWYRQDKTITPPQIGNFLTQPLINKVAASERVDTTRCIHALNALISGYSSNLTPQRK